MSPAFDFPPFSNLFRDATPPAGGVRDPLIRSGFLRTSTVFSGNAESWERYLNTPWAERRTHALDMEIQLEPDAHRVVLHPGNSDSERWARRLNQGLEMVAARLKQHKVAHSEYVNLIFQNRSNFAHPLHLHATEGLPGEATREIRFNSDQEPEETDIVLCAEMLQQVEERLAPVEHELSDTQRLGLLWPVLERVISQLGYPSYPRDRFAERIELTTRMSFLTIQLLFSAKNKGRLVPNEAGDLFLDYLARKEGIPKKTLHLRHPYYRMLCDLRFLLKEKNFEAFGDVTRVVVRDFLDQRYLRISIAGVMPGLMEWQAPMDFSWEKKKVVTPSPKIGRYGIHDKDDFKAWKKLEPALKDIGFVFLRQLGIGQFGRVYEAVNLKSGNIPERVAIKVDRIRKSKKEEAIQAVDTIMDISNGLSRCPHVIRIYDAGKLKPLNSTYHVLQLVKGDTVDNLIGVTGSEHASIYRPVLERTSVQDLKREYLKSIQSSRGEAWRRDRAGLPFVRPLGLSQAFDVMTSTLLWLEECHTLGFAINDLKNGNLMISRRGQLKGIDLDTYSPIRTGLDKQPDFFFLAITLLLFALRVLTEGHDENIKASGLLSDPSALDAMIRKIWRFGELGDISDGRVETNRVIRWLLDVIENSRSGMFAHEPEAFTDSINTLIRLKRGLVNEEMVLD